MKKITERELLAFTFRQAGETFKSIGNKMNITGNAARQFYNKYEVKVRYNAIISNFRSGKSIEWIAKHSDYSNAAIIDILKKEKLVSIKDIEHFVLLDYSRGINIDLIAKTYALDEYGIEKILRDEELKSAVVSDYLKGVKVYRLKQIYSLTAGEINKILKEADNFQQ